VALAAEATALPLDTEPVRATIRTRRWPAMAAPVSPAPVTTLNTPAGSTSRASSASRTVDSGVSSDGLRTTVSPAPSAGAIFQMAIARG